MIREKPTIEVFTDNRLVLSINRGRRRWEVHIDIDRDKDGGILVDIFRDDTCCTTAEFGWHDHHENETAPTPQPGEPT
jgi:hypothetical protein